MDGSFMKSAKAIVLLTPGFPASEEDTACLPFLQDWVLDYKQLYDGKKLYIISFQYPFKKGAYSWNGIEVFSAGGMNKKGLSKFLTWFRVYRAFNKIKKKENISGLISLWLTECTLVGQWLGFINKLPQLAYLIGQDADSKNRYLKLISFRKLRVAAVSEHIVERLKNTSGFEVSHIIPLGIREEKLDRASVKKNIDVLGVGSMIPLKNFEAFIKTVARLKQKHPGLKAVLVGGGPELGRLKELSKNCGLENSLIFTGAIPQKEVLGYMQQSRVLLHPSLSEGQATVFTEALACSMRVVCYDVGRVEAPGRIFIAKDEDGLYSITNSLLDDKSLVQPMVLKSMKETVYECVELLGKEI